MPFLLKIYLKKIMPIGNKLIIKPTDCMILDRKIHKPLELFKQITGMTPIKYRNKYCKLNVFNTLAFLT